MLKKLSKIGMLICLMAVATSAIAQNDGKAEYPRYGFWSNWSLGLSGSYNWQLEQGGAFDWRSASNAGMGIFLEQKMNHVFSVRGRYNFPSFWRPMQNEDGMTNSRYSSFTLDMKLSLNDAFKGYDPNRKFSFYVFAGGGLGFSTEDTAHTHYATVSPRQSRTGKVSILLDGGLGCSWKVGEHGTIFTEVEMDVTGDAPNIFKGATHDLNGLFTLGYMYNFGITAVDQEIVAQRALLTQENFDALNSQVSGLEEQLAACKANEQRLENRVAELENELANVKNNNCAAADSLQRLLDQMRSEQGTFYALPFSVLFDIDSYTVSGAESTKLKAIAQVMKDNPNTKFNVVGFCDYTGSDAYNQKLSEKRAEAVKKQLVNKYGIDADRLTVSGKGKNEAYGDTKLSINRRVSFFRAM